MKHYQILADEGWTHHETPPNRYHHFFVALLAPADVMSKLEQVLKNSIQKFIFNNHKEIKWSKLNARKFEDYKLLIDTFFDFWENCDELKYRQMFMDRKYEYSGETNQKEELFKLYYQFLKHSFGFDSEYFKSLGIENLLFKLDDYPDRERKEILKEYVKNVYKDFNVNIKFIDSKTSLIHQVIDILMGAAGYYGNFKCCKNKEPKIQDICKLKFAKYIQKKLEKIQKQDRNTKVFHWFESTGYVRSDLDKRHKFKIVIWKFIPNEHRIDSTWQHSKNKDIQKLKNKAKYLISKNFDECDVFKDKL